MITKITHLVYPIDVRNDALMDYVFPYIEGIIENGVVNYTFPLSARPDRPLTADEVLTAVTRPGVLGFAVLDPVAKVVAALVHLTDIVGQAACIHYSVNRDLPVEQLVKSGKDVCVALTQIPYFEGKPPFYTLIGKTPSFNFPAVRFAKRLGFREIDRIERASVNPFKGKPCDLVLTKLTVKDIMTLEEYNCFRE